MYDIGEESDTQLWCNLQRGELSQIPSSTWGEKQISKCAAAQHSPWVAKFQFSSGGCLWQGQHRASIPPIPAIPSIPAIPAIPAISKLSRSTYAVGQGREGKNAKRNNWFIFSPHMLPLRVSGAVPPKCRSLLRLQALLFRWDATVPTACSQAKPQRRLVQVHPKTYFCTAF